jgi:hypothetical protein
MIRLVLVLLTAIVADAQTVSGAVRLVGHTRSGPPVIYGGWTGGGATVTVSSCGGTDDTTTLQNALNTLANNGTLDITASTACAVNTAGIRKDDASNIRVTSSNNLGTIKGVAAGAYSTEYSSIFELDTCTNCLVDKLTIDANNTLGQAFFCHFCVNSSAQNTEMKNVAWSAGSAAGAILRFDGGTGNHIRNNNVHDSGGVNGQDGARGIWGGVGGEYETNIAIVGNTVADTGHTGLVSESSGPTVTGNTVTNTIVQGTGMKFIPRGAVADAVWDNNTITGTVGAGIMIEPSAVHPAHIYVRGNTFNTIGDTGTTFGALYLSGASGAQNVTFSGNSITSAHAVANMNYASNILLQDNTITTPVGAEGGDVILETSNHDITVNNSGNVVMQGSGICDPATGGNCFNIFEDSIQLALAPLPMRMILVAKARKP